MTPTSIDAPFVLQLRIVDKQKRESRSRFPSHAIFSKEGTGWFLREVR